MNKLVVLSAVALAGTLSTNAHADETLTFTLIGQCTGCFVDDEAGEDIPGTCFSNGVDETEVSTTLELVNDVEAYKEFRGRVELVGQCLPDFPHAPFIGSVDIIKQKYDDQVFYSVSARVKMGENGAVAGPVTFWPDNLEDLSPFYMEGVKARLEGDATADAVVKPYFVLREISVE